MAEKWTNTSAVPSSGAMKPKPLSALNHFTVPVAISSSPLSAMPHATSPHRPRAYRSWLRNRAPTPGHGLPEHQPLRPPNIARANALLRHSRRRWSWQKMGAAILDDAQETAEQAVLWPP